MDFESNLSPQHLYLESVPGTQSTNFEVREDSPLRVTSVLEEPSGYFLSQHGSGVHPGTGCVEEQVCFGMVGSILCLLAAGSRRKSHLLTNMNSWCKQKFG